MGRYRVIALFLVFFWVIPGAFSSALAQVTPLSEITWEYPQTTSPDAPVTATRFKLPLHWTSPPETGVKPFRLHVNIPLTAVPDQPWALLIDHLSEGGRYTLNGHVVGISSGDDAWRHVHWLRPTLIALDPSVLQTGNNDLVIDMAYGPGAHLIDGLWSGPYASLWNRAALDYFVDVTSPWIGITAAIICALAFSVFAYYQKSLEAIFLVVTAACWALYAGMPLIEIFPASLESTLDTLRASALGGFSLALALLIHQSSQTPVKRLLPVYLTLALIGPTLSLPGLAALRPYQESLWQPLVLILPALTCLGIFYRPVSSGRALPLSLLLGTLGVAGAATADMLVASGHSHLPSQGILEFAGTILLALVASPRLRAFSRQMRESDDIRLDLELRVKEREQLLKRNYERIRASERLQAESQERQRIMQDMHDGLGSQLMSALMLVERGGVGQDQFAQILRESIDDMRLAIDAMSTDDADLAAALGNLRFRMEPRFRAAGISLSWDARRLPEELGLHSDIVLPILRIVQESLTNALKHSRAKTIKVVLAAESSGEQRLLDIRVSDNGCGITEGKTPGRGLLNMRARAQKIGAQIRFETTASVGTTIHLRALIGPGQSPGNAETTVLNTQAVIEKVRQT